jgi:GT2 family glycosyltransferase
MQAIDIEASEAITRRMMMAKRRQNIREEAEGPLKSTPQRRIAKPKVSVVIVNWNTREMLKNCLRSVISETQSVPMEVIVIDNGSTDGSREMCRNQFHEVRLVENSTNTGFARAVNHGFELAEGEYILMLNSDTIILNKAIEKSIAFADSRPDAGIIGCRLLNPDRTLQDSCFRFPNLLGLFLAGTYMSQLFKNSYLLNWDRYGYRCWTTAQEVDCVMGSYMLIRASVLKDIGQLDTDYFMYGEETDYCFRVKKAGWKVVYYPSAEIVHVRGGTGRDWAGRAWAYQACQRGQLLFLCKRWNLAIGYIGNIIITFFIVPRLIVWFLRDLLSSIKNRTCFRPCHLLKGTSFWFHVKVLYQPRLLQQRWRRT